jgi:hypothetical protein
MPLTRSELDVIRALSEPLEQGRRESFVATIAQKVEAAAPNGAGEGFVHRVAAATQRDFFTPPLDQRRNRLGGRRG